MKDKIWPNWKSVYYLSFNHHGLSKILQQSDFDFQACSVQFFICPLEAIFTHSIWKAESKSVAPPKTLNLQSPSLDLHSPHLPPSLPSFCSTYESIPS